MSTRPDAVSPELADLVAAALMTFRIIEGAHSYLRLFHVHFLVLGFLTVTFILALPTSTLSGASAEAPSSDPAPVWAVGAQAVRVSPAARMPAAMILAEFFTSGPFHEDQGCGGSMVGRLLPRGCGRPLATSLTGST